jgi:hypothetical protein
VYEQCVLVGAGKGRGAGGESDRAAPKAAKKDEPKDSKDALANCCLRLTESAGKAGLELAWNAPKVSAYYATPLAHVDHAYFVNQVGVVYCLNLKTGDECYAQRIDSPCWASPIGAGKHVYFFGKDGRTTVLRTGPRFEKVASNRLWDPAKLPPRKPIDAPPRQADQKPSRRPQGPSEEYLDPIVYGVAAVDGAFFIRTGTALYRIGTASGRE